jgi:hypothetical protein
MATATLTRPDASSASSPPAHAAPRDPRWARYFIAGGGRGGGGGNAITTWVTSTFTSTTVGSTTVYDLTSQA